MFDNITERKRTLKQLVTMINNRIRIIKTKLIVIRKVSLLLRLGISIFFGKIKQKNILSDFVGIIFHGKT